MLKSIFLVSVFTLLNTNFLHSQSGLNIPIQGICIYIDYPDAPMTETPAELDGMLNDMNYQEPGINRSFRKYWHQETRGKYDIQHDIFHYTAPMPASFYQNLPWYEGILLWRDALEWVIAHHPDYDWSTLHTWSVADPFDQDRPDFFAGHLKLVTIISSVFSPAGVGAAHYPGWSLSNGVKVGTIQGSVIQAPWHPTRNLFVLIHESGHSLFNLPDTYDYDASSSGTAQYTVMSAQGPDVEPVGAPFLYQHSWVEVKKPAEGTHTFTLPADGDTIVVIQNVHDPKEYFALEVRKNTTLGNSLFPVPLGLLIWHADLKVNTRNTLEDATRYAHYQYSIVQKDGLMELENGGANNAGDIYVAGDVFSDETTPNAHWWSGEPSGIVVKDIVLWGDEVQFTVVIPALHAEHYEAIPKDNWSLVSETPAQNGFGGQLAFDDDVATYYHVPWGSTEPRPHELVIDLGETYEISEFYYTANDNFSPPWEGRIREYQLSFSENGVDWGSPIVDEQFFQTPYKQYALFPNAVAQYIRFSAINSYLDDVRTSVAEIDLRGRKFVPSQTKEADLASSTPFFNNPVSSLLQIGGLEAGHTVRIFSAAGVLATEQKSSGTSMSLNMMDYADGVWIVSVYDRFGGLVLSEKILKVR